ncbi:metallophosphoesterase [Ekhidna sp.]|uniref:metallophosphoesterase n=1 Tax=Ekhidna sp. TaxID=2608089 RepID=UPI003CCBEDBB
MAKEKRGRNLVMGDIHGNLKALNQCLERSEFNREEDVLIQLGDVGDRHPDTAQVIERLLSIPKLIAIRGNHDPWLSHWLKTNSMQAGWAENGGIPTVQSYVDAADSIDREKHLQFLKSQKNFHIDNQNRVFVHAGFTHSDGPASEEPSSNCYWDRSLWMHSLDALKVGQQPDLLSQFNEVFIGHTPTIKWSQESPMQAFNLWNLDTGAGWNGKLTIMDIDTKEYWQSDTSDVLY